MNARKSVIRAELSVRHLAEFFRESKAAQITTPRIKAYIEQRMELGAASGTINRELSALRRMFGLAQKAGMMAQIPYVPKLKGSAPRNGFFEHGDFLRLREAMPGYLHGFLTFAYRSGVAKVRDSRLDLGECGSEERYRLPESGRDQERLGADALPGR